MSSQTHTADNTITLTKCPGQTEDSMRSPITSHSKESLNVCQREKICCWVPEKNPDHTSSKKGGKNMVYQMYNLVFVILVALNIL